MTKGKAEPMLKIAKLLRFWSIMLSDCAHQKFCSGTLWIRDFKVVVPLEANIMSGK